MSTNKYHQPDLPVSWSLLELAEINGIIKSKIYKDVIGPSSSISYPIIKSINTQTRFNIIRKRKKYQNSDLDALPEKIKYFFKQIFVALIKFKTKTYI